MKRYIIVKEGYEYNDEYYKHGGTAELVHGYKTKDEAEAVCDKENLKEIHDDWFVDYNNEPIKPYKVVEVEVDD